MPLEVGDIKDGGLLTKEFEPKSPLPNRAGMKAAAYCIGAFAVFWFLRTGGLPEVWASIAAIATAYGIGWYDCKLGWTPYYQALDNYREKQEKTDG